VKTFLTRIEYHLRVILTEANFIHPEKFEKGDLTFEVSIGTVGNTEMLEDDQKNPGFNFQLFYFIFYFLFFIFIISFQLLID